MFLKTIPRVDEFMRENSSINFLLYCSISFPIFFALFVFITGNVNYPQATIESYKYIEIAKYWIDNNSTTWGMRVSFKDYHFIQVYLHNF